MTTTTTAMKSTANPQNALHQQLLASEPARLQLRDSLLSYLRATPDPSIPATDSEQQQPAKLWAIPAPAPAPAATAPAVEPPKLLVGDAETLQASLYDLAQSCHALSKACHRRPAPPTLVELHDDGLNWLRSYTQPTSCFEPLEGGRDSQVLDLLRLRCACASATKGVNFDALSPKAKREAAFDLARSLPSFNRDLTIFYLDLPAAETVPEYELHVAHSLLRLSPPTTTLDDFTASLRPSWRSSGMLHVLTIAAVQMPSASVDWRLPSPCPTTTAVQTLLQSLPGARMPVEAARIISRFVASAPGHGGTPMDKRAMTIFTCTLDRLATLMRVKTDAAAMHPEDHSLDAAIARHLPRPDQWTGELCPATLASLWASVKPALERSLPPSDLLCGDPATAGW